MKLVLPLALVAALALTPLALGGTTSPVRDCGDIAFTPNSDDMASGVAAKGVTCKYARGFVRAAEGTPGARFRGFSCTRTARDTALPSWRHRCTEGGRLIRWIKT